LSRQHHQGLLLCWKIRKGFSTNVDPERIKKYANWFFDEHLLQHFNEEEQVLFPILGNEHELIKKAKAEHRRLKRLFDSKTDIMKSLHYIEEELEQHIRFEERVLFNVIQDAATPGQLQKLENLHNEEQFCENSEDVFWK
jgi:iron-sulfur cluster repair protein YtfE (RIC family)